METMIFLLFVAGMLVAGVKYRRMMLLVADLRADLATAKAMLAKATVEQPKPKPTHSSYPDVTPTYIDYTPLAGAGKALAKPPSDLRTTLQHLAKIVKGEKYCFPLGWASDGLYSGCFVGDVNHILISGMSNAGKDNAVTGMLLSLALNHSPKDLQIGLIDGKGLDWLGWSNKAHTWMLADEPEKIAAAMARLTEERRRRRGILAAAQCASWDEYQGGDLPLLVVFISELSLLEDATKARELGAWLNSELSAGRAFGIRYIIGTQNASNFDTRWRGQISLFMAGFQPSRSADEPNTGMGTSDLDAIGAIAPSKLIAPPEGAGVFTVVHAPKAATIRVPFLTSQHRKWLLDQLPDAPKKALHHPQSSAVSSRAGSTTQPALDPMLAALLNGEPLLAESSTASSTVLARDNGIKPVFSSTLPSSSTQPILSVSGIPPVALPAIEGIDPDEVQKIVEAAPNYSSRRALCQALFGLSGGAPYNKVKLVCDALGLLNGNQPLQQAA
ncbi:cell divisionFtsK/SpoIIIE (plasmid) [Herpetosiphon aurantiacus DSM 785]|uniref:Cell divisionFtsK/SpoIIIE n=1 Tax=Herpetosiphon aurantiacus (strain ATCC 23779 / DSM 785 / 114-95) TaxID=316274 RepID=A9B9B0_HERA2|nr:cell divisionFtsK/SpoIIIE [Herpetosiphon aurantiacus DSM 785]